MTTRDFKVWDTRTMKIGNLHRRPSSTGDSNGAFPGGETRCGFVEKETAVSWLNAAPAISALGLAFPTHASHRRTRAPLPRSNSRAGTGSSTGCSRSSPTRRSARATSSSRPRTTRSLRTSPRETGSSPRRRRSYAERPLHGLWRTPTCRHTT